MSFSSLFLSFSIIRMIKVGIYLASVPIHMRTIKLKIWVIDQLELFG
jgi:hypothetical protein